MGTLHGRVLSKHRTLVNVPNFLVILTAILGIIISLPQLPEVLRDVEQLATETHFLDQVFVFLILYDAIHRYSFS